MSRLNYYGKVTFNMEEHLVSAFEAWFSRYYDFTIEKEDNRYLLTIEESYSRAANVMYNMGVFLNKYAADMEGNVICYDSTETEKDEYFIVDGKFKERTYFYDENEQKELKKEELVQMVKEADRIVNTALEDMFTPAVDALYNVLPDEVEGLIEEILDVANSSANSHCTIFFEDSKVVIIPKQILYFPFVPKTETELILSYGDRSLELHEIPLHKEDTPEMGIKIGNAFLPFDINYMSHGNHIKNSKGEWVEACIACANKLDALLNNGICKSGCKPILEDEFLIQNK